MASRFGWTDGCITGRDDREPLASFRYLAVIRARPVRPPNRSSSIVIGLLVSVALAGCGQKPAPPAQPPQVKLINPRSFVIPESANYQSTLEAIREVRLAPETGGRIVAMPVYEGQQVRPGQLLFVLDQIQQRAEVNADAAEARKNRYNAERYIFLNQQGAVSTKERDFYVTQAIQSRDKLQASLATLSYKNVVAPIPGYVGNLNYKIGDVIQAGAVVSSVIDNSKLWVRLDVPGELADRVRPGLPVILAGADPRRPMAQGVVSFVAPALDKQRQTLLVKAGFDNPDGALRNNQRVSATLIFSTQPKLMIPSQAVLMQAGKPFVFLAVSVEEAKRRLGRSIDPPPLPNLPVAIQVPVSLGTMQNGGFPVLQGLTAADTLVVGNLAQLRSGISIQPATPMLGTR
jgi:membrane fusion protein (multidrug efflux system)